MNRAQIIFATVIAFVLMLIVFLITIPAKPHNTVVIYKYITLSKEWAYFEGQKEALTGDVRIKFNKSTGKYEWIKSCWDNGTPPIFNPAMSENLNDYR